MLQFKLKDNPAWPMAGALEVRMIDVICVLAQNQVHRCFETGFEQKSREDVEKAIGLLVDCLTKNFIELADNHASVQPVAEAAE